MTSSILIKYELFIIIMTIWPINGTLIGTTIMIKSGPGVYGNELVLFLPISPVSCHTLESSFNGGGSYPSEGDTHSVYFKLH